MAGERGLLERLGAEAKDLTNSVSRAHRDISDPRAAGDLMRALNHLYLVRLELAAALHDLTTTTEPTTAGRE